MIRNWLILPVRNLLRNKEYFIINVFGLAVGMACAILVLVNIWEHSNFDSFHPDSDRLYRVYIDTKMGGLESKVAVTSPLFAFTLKSAVPEIEQACRVFRMERDIKVKEPVAMILDRRTLLFADSTFFDLFGFRLLEGDPVTCLNQPRSIVLSRSLSLQMFPTGGALGKTILVENEKEWTVTGIVQDVPENTHLKYDAIVSFNSAVLPENVWTTNYLYTYYRFRPGTDFDDPASPGFLGLSVIENKLTEAFLNKAKEEFKQTIGMSLEDLHQDDNYYVLRLQNIKDIHIFSHLRLELSQNVNIQTFMILGGIALLIILIGCINYANLSTARLAGRVRETGIRKILGSRRSELSKHLLAESVTISFISLFFALVIVELSYPQVNLLPGNANPNIQLLLLRISPAVLIVTFLTGLIAGIYPAFYVIRFSPATILRQHRQISASGKSLRGVLVILQFVFSITIIFSTSTIYRQLRYIQLKGVGFEKENLIVVDNAWELKSQSENFRKQLLLFSEINEVSFSNSVPGQLFHMTSFQSGENRRNNHLMQVMESDSMIFKTFRMTLSEGNFRFGKSKSGDTLDAVINREAANYMGLQHPIGTVFYQIGNNGEAVCLIIRGVVENFNTESLHSKIQPLVMLPQHFASLRYVTIRLNQPADSKLISKINSLWSSFLPSTPFMHFSIEESLGAFYAEEQSTARIALIFSFFAIFIACMGLYSLLALTTVFRTKEIGIRKVLGAGSRELVLLLTKELFKLIVISGLIALPVAFFSSYYWLNRFAYHVPVSIINYVLVFIAVLLVAVFTVYRQLRRTISADPSESLRYE
jgi:putative ABC transport system permease protein